MTLHKGKQQMVRIESTHKVLTKYSQSTHTVS